MKRLRVAMRSLAADAALGLIIGNEGRGVQIVSHTGGYERERQVSERLGVG